MSDPRLEIARLEAELDELEAAGERCRKTIILAKVAAATGAALLAVDLWRFDPLSFVVGTAALLGGLAISGSTGTTRREIMATIEETEARRAEMIDALNISPLEGL